MKENEVTFKAIEKSLTTLANALITDNTATYREWFDEFMREGEYSLALHILCDYLSLEEKALITTDRIMIVQELHSMMMLDCNCVSELERIQCFSPTK